MGSYLKILVLNDAARPTLLSFHELSPNLKKSSSFSWLSNKMTLMSIKKVTPGPNLMNSWAGLYSRRELLAESMN